jgi:hypothetical protein
VAYGSTSALSTTGGSGTGAVTYSVSAPSKNNCSVLGNVLTADGASGACEVMATKAADNNYMVITSLPLSITLTKATPAVTAWPTASDIIVGQTLVDATLTGGSASTSGSFAFTTPTISPAEGTADYEVTFTPDDTSHYTTVTGLVSVTVLGTGGLKTTIIGATQGIGFGSLGAMSFLLNHKLFGRLFRRRRKLKGHQSTSVQKQ